MDALRRIRRHEVSQVLHTCCGGIGWELPNRGWSKEAG